MSVIDSVILIGFLVINVFIGVFSGSKINSIKDYALSNRNFNDKTLISTLVATWASGSLFAVAITKVYTQGLIHIFALTGIIVSFVLVGYFFALRIGEFLGSISVAECMGRMYGKKVRIISAISGFIGVLGIIAVQFKVFGSVFNIFFGFENKWATVTSAFVVIFYSAYGGIRSVAFTDVLQFLVFCFLLPILASSIITSDQFSFSSFVLVWDEMFDDILDTISMGNLSKFFSLLTLFLYCCTPRFEPAFFQRISMSKNVVQLRKVFVCSGIICFSIAAIISLIGIMVKSINPNLQPLEILPYLVENFTFPGLKGIFLIGILALSMSTADSHINSSSILFSHDFCAPMNLDIGNKVIMSRLFTIILGLASLSVALFSTRDLLGVIMMAVSFYMPIVEVPLILAILGFRSTTRCVLIGMFAGLVTVILWRVFFLDTGVDSVIPGMIGNLVFLLASHYMSGNKNAVITNPLTTSVEKKNPN